MSAYLILTLSAVFFGGTWVAGEVAVAGLPPMTIASVRFIIASALLYGLRLAPASDGAIIVPGFAPVFTVLLAWPILRERIGAWTVAGFAVAIAGLYFVIGPGGGEQSSNRLLGDIFFILGAFCWGIYAVAGKTATSRFTPVTSTLYAAAPAVSWAGLLYLGTFGTVLAFVFFL